MTTAAEKIAADAKKAADAAAKKVTDAAVKKAAVAAKKAEKAAIKKAEVAAKKAEAAAAKKAEQQQQKDETIIEAIAEAIQAGECLQAQITAYCKDKYGIDIRAFSGITTGISSGVLYADVVIAGAGLASGAELPDIQPGGLTLHFAQVFPGILQASLADPDPVAFDDSDFENEEVSPTPKLVLIHDGPLQNRDDNRSTVTQ